ncbi:MAG: preprotein translocase subunit YajC [Clostridiales Family XIII bacterium]|jgi:preprotein translocase subunit YajC|nr:preprotein translocase subunit YajC [Clostridiales Family XIII bacterium]
MLGGQGGSIIILILIFAVMYFVMIRPQRKKQKQVEEMRAGVKAGDRITTIGGLRGKVVRVTDDVIMIDVGPDKVRMEFMKWAVSKVEDKGAPMGAADKSGKAEAEAKEEPAEEEAEAPKTVKKPKRLGFKAPEPDAEEEGGKEAEE